MLLNSQFFLFKTCPHACDTRWILCATNTICCTGYVRPRVRMGSRTWPILTCLTLIYFFYLFRWYLGLNSWPHACYAGGVPLEPHLHRCFQLRIYKIAFHELFSYTALHHICPELCLLSSSDYRPDQPWPFCLVLETGSSYAAQGTWN
jgi:hypothetical protein